MMTDEQVEAWHAKMRRLCDAGDVERATAMVQAIDEADADRTTRAPGGWSLTAARLRHDGLMQALTTEAVAVQRELAAAEKRDDAKAVVYWQERVKDVESRMAVVRGGGVPPGRWHTVLKRDVDDPRADAFLDDIEAVCRKHGLTLSHEDTHGAFIVEDLREETLEWLHHADTSISPAGDVAADASFFRHR